MQDGAAFDLPPAEDGRRWWVGFRDFDAKTVPRWWDMLFTSDGFRHCYAFTELTPGQILYTDPLAYGMEVRLMIGLPLDLIQTAKAKGHRVLCYRMPPAAAATMRGPLLTCAAIVGHILKLDSRAVTPRGLYRAMMRSGCAVKL